MKLRKLYTLILPVIVYGSSYGQTYTYSVKSNESDKINLLANFSLLDFNLGFPTLSLGAGADVDYYTKKRISAEANLHFAYWDMKRSLLASTNDNQNSLARFNSWRLGGRFHLVDRDGKRKMKAIISSKQVGNTVYTKYIPMKVPCRKIVALHFGIEHMKTVVSARRDSFITASDGTKIGEFASPTSMGVNMIYAGFSFVKIMNTRMEANGDTWYFKWYKHTYLDVMYAPAISIKDIQLSGKKYIVQGHGAKGFYTNPFGFRLGINNVSRKGMGVRYEIGWMPGLQGRGLYTQASFGIPLLRSVKIPGMK